MKRANQTPAKNCADAIWYACQVWNWANSRCRVFLKPDEREIVERALSQALDDLKAVSEVLNGDYARKKAKAQQTNPSA